MPILAAHQPNFLPWQGYFEKMARCDVFVILDNVQYEKDSFTNRVKIKTPKGTQWLTMSIKNKYPQLINEVEFANFTKDRDRILKTIELNYKKAPGFKTIFPLIERMLSGDWKNLSGFNTSLIYDLGKGLYIKPKLEVASSYKIEGQSTERLINLCKYFGADTYLSGYGAKDYQEEEKFKKEGIKLEYLKFDNPPYKQLWGEFVPGLSIIDYLLSGKYD
jgi:hypothetical protein